MTKLICSDKLILQLQMEIKDVGENFIKVRDEFRDRQQNEPIFFGHSEYQVMLIDDLAKLAGIDQRLDTLDHVIKLIESGAYDYND